MEDEDCIVEEIPVFFSKSLKDNLYVFQYQTRTPLMNTDRARVESCCVKPITKEVKVDFAFDVNSEYFDSCKAEQMAIAAGDKNLAKSERATCKRGIMDKQTYTSKRTLHDMRNYTVGIYADKEIHLTTLSTIVQMQPSFSCFDKEDKRKQAEKKAENLNNEGEGLQQVVVKFSRNLLHAKKVKETSIDESWCKAYWHSSTSPATEMERQKLFATNRQANEIFSLEPHRYLDKLSPIIDNLLHIDEISGKTIINKTTLKTKTLVEQIENLLKMAKMINFTDIMSFLMEDLNMQVDGEKVLRVLTQVGILLHGNWVIQSELLYPADTSSNTHGIPSEVMVKARDYVIFRFSRTTYLFRRQIMAVTQLPNEEAIEVLESIARLNKVKSWELLLPADIEFERRHPELVERQEMIWRATENIFDQMDNEKSERRMYKRSIRETKPQISSE